MLVATNTPNDALSGEDVEESVSSSGDASSSVFPGRLASSPWSSVVGDMSMVKEMDKKSSNLKRNPLLKVSGKVVCCHLPKYRLAND